MHEKNEGNTRKITLSACERETHINFTDDEQTVSIYTRNKSLMKRLARLSEKSTACVMIEDDEWSQTYNVPKSWVSIRLPATHTEETKAKMAARAKRLSEQRKTMAIGEK